MSQLFSQLTFSHVTKGWSVYWRISLPYWIHVLYIMSVLAFALYLPEIRAIHAYKRFIPEIVNFPYLFNILIGLALYFLGLHFLRKFKKLIARLFESEFYRAQYSMFSSVDKINRVLVGFVAALVFFFVTQADKGFMKSYKLGFWLGLCIFLLVCIVGIFVALYGWLSDQLDDIKDKRSS